MYDTVKVGSVVGKKETRNYTGRKVPGTGKYIHTQRQPKIARNNQPKSKWPSPGWRPQNGAKSEVCGWSKVYAMFEKY